MPEQTLFRFLQKRRDAITVGLLIAGLVAACLIYVHASLPGESQERPDDSKQYLRQMEVYGGTANVLASELREWFAGLWQGRRLAFTVAFLGVLLAAGARLALTPLPPQEEEP